MACAELDEDATQTFIASPTLFPETLGINGLTRLPGKDSVGLNWQTPSASQAVLDVRSLQRRKSSPRPRLPRFESLGISSFGSRPARDSRIQSTKYAILERGMIEHSCLGHAANSPSQALRPPEGPAPLPTPPEDLISLNWTSCESPHQPAAPSISHTCGATVTGSSKSIVDAASSSGDGAPNELSSLEPTGTGECDSQREAANANAGQSPTERIEANSWLGQSVGAAGKCSLEIMHLSTEILSPTGAVMSIDPSNPSSSTIQIVSQTLPNPGKENARPNALFTEVIAAVQTRFGTSRQPYITITHAVPPRFELLNLPSSPPSTPNLSIGRDDYFTQSIFAHAAVVPSYHVTNSLATAAPPSPNPIVPPSSVQISVLERYIPPSSPEEPKELFSLSGQSVLIDRLAELSPARGSMLFIYPTKLGARTFTSKYLSHILDPLLRALVEVHQLSYGLAESLGSMTAVTDMHGFEALKAKTSSLCRRMSHQITSDVQQSHFNLVYASPGQVAIDRRTWTEWYLKQEHARFKRTLEAYWGRGRRLSQLESASAGTVLREFIDGVNKMTNHEVEQTGPEIEVGVFVIRRTLASSSG